jgi:hypothetical protein
MEVGQSPKVGCSAKGEKKTDIRGVDSCIRGIEISERFFIKIRRTGVVQKEFNV